MAVTQGWFWSNGAPVDEALTDTIDWRPGAARLSSRRLGSVRGSAVAHAR